MKTLGICIPSYNYGHYLCFAIDSCLASQADFELVVLDNASVDSTNELRSRYITDPRVKWYRNDTLLPVQANWNKAVSLTNAKWIKLLQADDVLCSGAVDRMLEMISLYPDAGFHAHLAYIMNASGLIVRKPSVYKKDGHLLHLRPMEGLPLKLAQVARLKEPTCNLFKKDAWVAIGGYEASLRFTFDVAYNVELMSRYSGVLWSEALCCVRRHGASDGARLPAALALADLEAVVNRIVQKSPNQRNRRLGYSLLQYRLGELFLQRVRSQPINAFKFLFKNYLLIFRCYSWGGALAIVARKLMTGDVQKTIN